MTDKKLDWIIGHLKAQHTICNEDEVADVVEDILQKKTAETTDDLKLIDQHLSSKTERTRMVGSRSC